MNMLKKAPFYFSCSPLAFSLLFFFLELLVWFLWWARQQSTLTQDLPPRYTHTDNTHTHTSFLLLEAVRHATKIILLPNLPFLPYPSPLPSPLSLLLRRGMGGL